MDKLICELFVFLLAGLFAGRLTAGDFREAKWGMTQKKVKQVKRIEEKAELIIDRATPGRLDYYSNVLGLKALMVYEFQGGKLFRVRCLIDEDHENPDLYFKDYQRLKTVLQNKYGPPRVDHPLEAGETEKAVITGHLSAWVTDRTRIYLLFYNDRVRDRLVLSYLDRQHDVQSSEELINLYSALD